MRFRPILALIPFLAGCATPRAVESIAYPAADRGRRSRCDGHLSGKPARCCDQRCGYPGRRRDRTDDSLIRGLIHMPESGPVVDLLDQQGGGGRLAAKPQGARRLNEGPLLPRGIGPSTIDVSSRLDASLSPIDSFCHDRTLIGTDVNDRPWSRAAKAEPETATGNANIAAIHCLSLARRNTLEKQAFL